MCQQKGIEIRALSEEDQAKFYRDKGHLGYSNNANLNFSSEMGNDDKTLKLKKS